MILGFFILISASIVGIAMPLWEARHLFFKVIFHEAFSPAQPAARTGYTGPRLLRLVAVTGCCVGSASLQTLLPSALAQQLLLLRLEEHWRASQPPMLRLSLSEVPFQCCLQEPRFW